jgi:L-2,4-diaminobutyrate decarboxylase
MPDILSSFVGPGGMSRARAREVLERALHIGLDFKYRQRYRNGGDDSALRGSWSSEPLPESRPVDEILSELESVYLPHLPNMSTPNFAGFPDSGNHVGAIAGAILGELVNVNMINSTISSSGATEMEMAVIGWLRQLAGYHIGPETIEHSYDCGGVPTQGGTGANYVAMLLALARSDPGRKLAGHLRRNLAVLIPDDIGHYTVEASANWTGLGEDAVVRAPVRDYRYDLAQLPDILRRMRDQGRELTMAVAYAGDSRTMTIDSLPEVAGVVRDYYPNAWLHCDGCHGTSLLFSDRHRTRLSGIDAYDSIAVDPHKVLCVPFTSSYLLVRNPSDLRTIVTDAELILTQARSMGQITPVSGTRSFTSLRTWMLLKTLGVEGVGRVVDARLASASCFARLVDATPQLHRMNEVDMNSVAFIVLPEGVRVPLSPEEAQVSDSLTRRVYERMLEDGEFYLHSFRLPDSCGRLGLSDGHKQTVLRYMSGNVLMDERVQQRLVQYVLECAK